jgi:hypothetical protein
LEEVEPKAIGRPRASMVTIEVEVGLDERGVWTSKVF